MKTLQILRCIISFSVLKCISCCTDAEKPPGAEESRAVGFAARWKAVRIGDVRARREQIQNLIGLFESGSADNVAAALDMMGGGTPHGDNNDARDFYMEYIQTVVQKGDDSDKVQAAQLLRAIARAVPIDKTSRSVLFLWGAVSAPPPRSSGDDPLGAFTVPAEKKRNGC